MNSTCFKPGLSRYCWAAGIFSLCCSLSLHAASLQCEGVTLSIIDQSARANLKILEGAATDADVESALQMPGNLALIQKSNQSGVSNTVDDLRLAFRTARKGDTPVPDLFGIGRLRDDMDEAKDLLNLLDLKAEEVIRGVCTQLTPYLPETYKADIRVFILAGGFATGFTFDEGTDFYLAAQRIGNDPAGLELIIVHEIFHVVQSTLSPLTVSKMDKVVQEYPVRSRALAHLFNGYLEGGASWVANADNYSGEGPTIRFFKDAQGKYSQQFKRLFVTFEAYLYQLYNDPDADPDQIYAAGFMDDGPLYYVGFYMARELEKDQGAQVIRDLLNQSPTHFYEKYQSLCHANAKLLCFSPTTEKIIQQTASWIRQQNKGNKWGQSKNQKIQGNFEVEHLTSQCQRHLERGPVVELGSINSQGVFTLTPIIHPHDTS